MDALIEIILELIIEGAAEGAKSKSFPKTIRYILLGAIVMIFSCIMVLLIYSSIVIASGLLVRLLLFGTGLLIAVYRSMISAVVFVENSRTSFHPQKILN